MHVDATKNIKRARNNKVAAMQISDEVQQASRKKENKKKLRGRKGETLATQMLQEDVAEIFMQIFTISCGINHAAAMAAAAPIGRRLESAIKGEKGQGTFLIYLNTEKYEILYVSML